MYLSEKIKERMLQAWVARYNPQSGGRRPLFLDGGLEVDNLTNISFKELDFQEGIKSNEKIILELFLCLRGIFLILIKKNIVLIKIIK